MSLPPGSVLLPAEAVSATAGAAVPPLVATLIAMDLRLPAVGEARERQVGLLNHLVDGTDVFVQTDREFAPIVERELRRVAAVEYADGDPPPMSDPERRQWWRLQQVWALLRRHEREIDHRYEFVFKLRTDLDITGAARLADIYSQSIRPSRAPASAYLLADRLVGAPPSVMERIAGLFGDPFYDGLRGVCGGCGALPGALRSADSGARVFELALGEGDVPSLGCEDAHDALGRPLERDALGALQTHLTRQYGRPVHPQLPPSDLATYARRSAHRRQEGRAGGGFHAVCAFSNTFRPGHNFSSEVSLVLQLVRAGVRVEPFRSIDTRLIGDGFGLATWRHPAGKEVGQTEDL